MLDGTFIALISRVQPVAFLQQFQLYLAATVANLTLVAAKAGLTGETAAGPSAGSAQVAGMVNSATAWLGRTWTLTSRAAALLTKSLFPIRGFRPGF